jgi:hypothetical protein
MLTLAWFEDLHAFIDGVASDLERVADQVWQKTLGPVRSLEDEELHKALDAIAKTLEGIAIEVEHTMEQIEEQAEEVKEATA